MMRALTLAVVLLCACNCASTGTPKAVPVSPAPAAAPGSEAPSACVQACTDGRRMEAIGWEVIVSQCEAQCAAEGSR